MEGSKLTTDATTKDLLNRLEQLERRVRAMKRGILAGIILFGALLSAERLFYFEARRVQADDGVRVGEHILLSDGAERSFVSLDRGPGKIWLATGKGNMGPSLRFDDADGQPRLRLGLRADGSPGIAFMDKSGDITWSHE